MFSFLQTYVRERLKYEKRIQTSVDNRVNDLHYEIKFENCMKDKRFKTIIKHLITSAFFFCRGRLKNIDMPRQNYTRRLIVNTWHIMGTDPTQQK